MNKPEEHPFGETEEIPGESDVLDIYTEGGDEEVVHYGEDDNGANDDESELQSEEVDFTRARTFLDTLATGQKIPGSFMNPVEDDSEQNSSTEHPIEEQGNERDDDQDVMQDADLDASAEEKDQESIMTLSETLKYLDITQEELMAAVFKEDVHAISKNGTLCFEEKEMISFKIKLLSQKSELEDVKEELQEKRDEIEELRRRIHGQEDERDKMMYEIEELKRRQQTSNIQLQEKDQLLEGYSQKEDQLRRELRQSKRKVHSSMLAIGALALLAGGMGVASWRKGGQAVPPVGSVQENTDPSAVAPVQTSQLLPDVPAVASLESSEENTREVAPLALVQETPRIVELRQKIQEHTKEILNAQEKIREIDEWISLQTEDYWKQQGSERKQSWVNYANHQRSLIVEAQEEMINLLQAPLIPVEEQK